MGCKDIQRVVSSWCNASALILPNDQEVRIDHARVRDRRVTLDVCCGYIDGRVDAYLRTHCRIDRDWILRVVDCVFWYANDDLAVIKHSGERSGHATRVDPSSVGVNEPETYGWINKVDPGTCGPCIGLAGSSNTNLERPLTLGFFYELPGLFEPFGRVVKVFCCLRRL